MRLEKWERETWYIAVRDKTRRPTDGWNEESSLKRGTQCGVVGSVMLCAVSQRVRRAGTFQWLQ